MPSDERSPSRLPATFSRAAFLASDDATGLCEALAEALRERLAAASDRSREEGTLIEELIALGHPLRLFDSQSGDAPVPWSGASWIDDWSTPGPGGVLSIETSYPVQPAAAYGASHAITAFQIEICFRGTRDEAS
jgi:hypothetical protein